MRKKTILSMLLLVLVMIIVVIFIEYNRSPSLETPSVTEDEVIEEEEIELEENSDIPMDEEDDDEGFAEEEEEETEEQTFPARVLSVIRDTFSTIFSQEVHVVAIGDSLTQGIGDETNQGGYVGIMERVLNYDNQVVQFENFGKRGNRSEQLLKRLEEPEIIEAIEQTDFVFVTIGANDIMKVTRENITNLQLDVFKQERDDFDNKLRMIVDEIHELNSDAELYLLGIYNPFEMYFGDIEEINLIVESWNDTIRTITEEEDFTTFIPVDDLFQDETMDLFADDNFHPNQTGYFLIAQRVLEYVTEEDE